MNRLASRRLGAILACLTILAIFGTISFPAVASAAASDARPLAIATDNVMAAAKPSGISISPATAVIDSTNTRLLVALSKYNSIDELKKPPGYRTLIGLGSDTEISWLDTALNCYGIYYDSDYYPVIIPESDVYYALIRGVVDAYLVTSHPSPYLQTAIESEEFRLLPWSEEAVAAVVEANPYSVIPAQLPANTYAGQRHAIFGYAPPLQPITLTEDFTLTSDMTFTGTGFIIGADNITLNLNGHTITGSYPPIPPPGCPHTTGVIMDGHTGVTIKNGMVRGFNNGIAIMNSDNSVIKGLVVTGNTGAGLRMAGSDNNRIADNIIEGNGRAGIGIAAASNHNEIRDNLIRNNQDGIRVGVPPPPPPNPPPPPPANNLITGNTIDANGVFGILIIDGSHDNEIRDNNIRDNGSIGIFVTKTPAAPPVLPIDPVNNQINSNKLSHNANYDIQDVTSGDGDLGTANFYEDNKGKTSDPAGLVQ